MEMKFERVFNYVFSSITGRTCLIGSIPALSVCRLAQTRNIHCSTVVKVFIEFTKPQNFISNNNNNNNNKAIPLQAWTGPKGSRRMRLPDFKTIGT